ncbi:MAG: IPTL-CTERM sorting domain-containing protein [Burkholderiaceae bacterium]|nr:IPTL-CTERM sorting domain-containing protein [Burkholderiaceae bacterium]
MSCTLTAVTAPASVTAQFAPQSASAQAIPTLGEWAMLLLSGLMGIAALGVLRRR